MLICSGNEPMEKIGSPKLPQSPHPPAELIKLSNFPTFCPISMKLGKEVRFGVTGPNSRPPYSKTTVIANFGNFGPDWLKIGRAYGVSWTMFRPHQPS